ncbi:hypothetical protein [Pseudomonas gessardii]|uniref:hypothetical protein n=1 Tax=Pseudomonas gessardii TaxID=78544 RepID=UPI001473D843|nr:hypothetical protein [Pseudomonas gessardii]NNA66415.1 hypothetical protein [Pseudomonas gessardii]
MSRLHLHFDGDITRNHTVSLRTLGNSLYHLQAAVNRAHLDTKFGEVWKGARLSKQDYLDTELWSRPPENGGYIIDFIDSSPRIKKTLTRMIQAITPAVEKSNFQALKASGSLVQQAAQRFEQVRVGTIEPQSFESYMPTASQNPYGDRAINKEIDLLAGIVRTPNAGQSTVELIIDNDRSYAYKFNRVASENFHALVSNRMLGEPLIFSVKVTELDSTNKTAKIFNVLTERTVKLTYANEEDFSLIKPFLGIQVAMNFIGSPVYEGGAFDAKGGDLFFIGLANG